MHCTVFPASFERKPHAKSVCIIKTEWQKCLLKCYANFNTKITSDQHLFIKLLSTKFIVHKYKITEANWSAWCRSDPRTT